MIAGLKQYVHNPVQLETARQLKVPIKTLKKIARFATADGGSIGTRVLRSGIWVGVSEVGLQLLNLARSVFLARLLSPEMFGLMGLAMIVVRAIETFTRPGVSQALIARQRSFDEASATAFTLLVLRGLLLAVLLAAVAPWVGRFYDSQELGGILQVLSVVFVLGSFSNINVIARQRELEFRKLTYLGQSTALIGTTVTVVVAWMRRDVWALVIGQVVQVTANVLLSYFFVGGRMHFAFDREVARELLSYGKFITGSSIVLYICTEMDSAVIGKMLGPGQLGFYTLAFTIAHLATANLSKVTSSIMMPAYSKLQSDLPALRAGFLKTLSVVFLVVAPATAGLIVVASPLLFVVYGEKWLDAAQPLQILALFGMFRALAAFSGYLFEGMGKPKIAFQLGVLRLLVIAPIMFPMIEHFGLRGAAGAVTLGIAAQWLGSLFYLKRHLSVHYSQLVQHIWRPVWTSCVMAAAVYAAGLLVDAHTLLGLAVSVVCGVLVYAALNWSVVMQLKRSGLRSA